VRGAPGKWLPTVLLTGALLALLPSLSAPQASPASARTALPPLQLGDRGRRVLDAQWLMSGHNVFRARTYRGPLDGVFGPQTRDAALAIKWQLGYRADQIQPIFGRDLYEILLGRRKLPPLYAVRRASRHPFLRIQMSFPLAVRGQWIGYPGQGTHSWWAPPANWESDNAVDIAATVGVPVLAVEDGQVCGGFGRLTSSSTSRFAGLRFHLCAASREWYYAHLSRFAPGLHVGARVRAGETLGYSGSANGVGHLHIACKGAHVPDEDADAPLVNGCDVVAILRGL